MNDGSAAAIQRYKNAIFNTLRGGIALSVARVEPDQGPAGGSLTLSVTGSKTNFQNGTSVSFEGGGISVSDVRVISPTQLEVTISIDAAATLGFRDVVVTTNLGGALETARGAGVFEVIEAPSGPKITGITPASGAAGDTLTVTVNGINTHFSQNSVLDVGSGVTVSDISAASAMALHATLQIDENAAVGYRNVSVFTGTETATENAIGPFLVTLPSPDIPKIVSISPAEGHPGDTIAVTIAGANTSFAAGTSSVNFSGSGITVLDATVIGDKTVRATLTIALNASATFRDVSVITGSEIATSLQGFKVNAGPGNGLTAYYSFHEGSGTLVADASGLSPGGTIHGASWTTEGITGTALQFDGTDDYMIVPDSDSLDLASSFTMTAWVRPAVLSGTILSKDGLGADPNGAYNLYLTSGGGIKYETNNLGGLLSADGVITVNTWHHVAVTFDESASPRMHLYVNGVECGAGDVSTPSALANDLLIGRRGWNATPRHFMGKIDEVSFYTRALSDRDIAALYTRYTIPALMALYPFDEGSGSLTSDATGYGHDGTINGASWDTAGLSGHALQFDGVGDYVLVQNSDRLNVTDRFTLTAWVRPAVLSGTILSKDGLGADPNGAYNVYLTSGGGIKYETNNLGGLLSADGVITVNTWHHVAVTFDESASPRMHLYVDGVECGAGDVSAPSALSRDLLIGRRGWNATPRHFTGSIDEVRIYNSPLTSSEIQALATETESSSRAFSKTQSLDERSLLAESKAGGLLVEKLVTVEGATLTINLADSPDLNYGVGDFTIVVTVRTEARYGDEKPTESHVAVSVRDGETLALYLNGVLQGEQTIGDRAVNRLMVDVGLDQSNAVAVVEDVQLFDEALTPDELAQRMKNEK